MDVAGCLGCDLLAGRAPLPGGVIVETTNWVVNHCVGPLNVGTLIVAPRRHVTAVAELSDLEVAELGPCFGAPVRWSSGCVHQNRCTYACGPTVKASVVTFTSSFSRLPPTLSPSSVGRGQSSFKR